MTAPNLATDVVPLSPHDAGPAQELLGRAFFDDPLYHYFLPTEQARKAHIAWLTGLFVRYGLLYGAVQRPADQLHAVSVWIPPNSGEATPWRMLRAGAISALWRLGLQGMQQMLAVSDYYDRLRHAAVPEPHWYLMILGVDPLHQGQGLGGHLLTPVLAEADRQGHPCYLETSKERNLPFYQRHGFQVVEAGELPKGGPAYWTMLRPVQR